MFVWLSEFSKFIYGDIVQFLVFVVEDQDKMDDLVWKWDCSVMLFEQKYYDVDWEIWMKGMGFFKFSKDEEMRMKEMEQFVEECKRIEEERKVRESEKEKRCKEIEEWRKEMVVRRVKKQVDSFLDGME